MESAQSNCVKVCSFSHWINFTLIRDIVKHYGSSLEQKWQAVTEPYPETAYFVSLQLTAVRSAPIYVSQFELVP
jgi:hypothetical protein